MGNRPRYDRAGCYDAAAAPAGVRSAPAGRVMNPIKWLAIALGAAGFLLAAFEAHRGRNDPLARWAA
jgi:hypothetical protein